MPILERSKTVEQISNEDLISEVGDLPGVLLHEDSKSNLATSLRTSIKDKEENSIKINLP